VLRVFDEFLMEGGAQRNVLTLCVCGGESRGKRTLLEAEAAAVTVVHGGLLTLRAQLGTHPCYV
jgi:hypothetical protein